MRTSLRHLSWFGNEEFTEDQSKLIKRITEDYVYTTSADFGTEKYAQIVEYMWNELDNVLGKPAEVGFSEDYDIRDRLLIDSLIHEYQLMNAEMNKVFRLISYLSSIRQQF